ncbi:MAG: prepilin-type N-terminal cleavage/methylation domain-containing protein [Gammaproteobacteria bacterium]|nr:prepilin-type N-terminal cleavage/methylation domain-containing protein [Gammaproteobacteria bacterium]
MNIWKHAINPNCCGYSLLEVLLALFILSLGLLGIAALQTISIKRNMNAYLHSVAVTQMAAATDRFAVGNMSAELSYWNQANTKLLPKGQGSYDSASHTLTLCWFSNFKHNNNCLTYD